VRASGLVGVMAAGFVVMGAGTAAAQSASDMTPLETAVACGAPVLNGDKMDHAVHVIGAQDTVARTTFDNRDLIVVDAGTSGGVQLGQEYYVRGQQRLWAMHFVGGSSDPAIRTAGWIRIVAANERTAIAQVIHACGVILQGDYLEPYKAPALPDGIDRDDPTGDPDFSALGHVVSGPEDHRTSAPGEFVVIDRGSKQGIKPGQRFAVYRDLQATGMPLASIGEAIAVEVGEKESLVRITRARTALETGDYVAPRK